MVWVGLHDPEGLFQPSDSVNSVIQSAGFPPETHLHGCKWNKRKLWPEGFAKSAPSFIFREISQ